MQLVWGGCPKIIKEMGETFFWNLKKIDEENMLEIVCILCLGE